MKDNDEKEEYTQIKNSNTYIIVTKKYIFIIIKYNYVYYFRFYYYDYIIIKGLIKIVIKIKR